MLEEPTLRFWLYCLAGLDGNIIERAQALNNTDWKELDTLSRRHQLTPLFYLQLKQRGAISFIPSQLREEWQQTYHASTVTSLLRERELRLILKALAQEKISPILFKGAHLAFFIYPTPACRPMGDLDLWIPREEMPRAQTVLERLGYVQRGPNPLPQSWQIERDGEIQMFGQNARQGLVELHWGAFHGAWLHLAADIDRAGVEARTQAVTLGAFPARVLEPADALIQVALHLVFCTPLSGEAMKPLLDIHLLAREINNWGIVIERARKWHVANAVGSALAMCATLFGLPEAQLAILQLRPCALRRWLIHPYVNPASLLADRDEARVRLRWLFRLTLVDRFQDAMRILLRAIRPEKAWVRMRRGNGT